MTKNSTWNWNQAEDLEPQHQILGHEWAVWESGQVTVPLLTSSPSVKSLEL